MIPLAAFLFLAWPSLAEPDASAMTGRQILDRVIDRLPRERLDIRGDLIVRKPRGVVLQALKFEMLLDWGALPAVARYTIRDAFGDPVEQLTVLRDASGARFEYESGNPLTTATVPSLARRVQETDVTWTDLALSFLWWPEARRNGSDSVRGRDCYIVDVSAPESDAAADTNAYRSVRLWIDEKLFMMLKAEGRDDGGTPVRGLWVDSFKKIDDRWMIKDMEIQAYPPVHRTKLRVREVKAGEPSTAG